MVPLFSLLLLCYPGVHTAQYDFGLLENTPLLSQLYREDRLIHRELTRLESEYTSDHLGYYIKQGCSNHSVKQYVSHPVNSYNLIRRAALGVKELLEDLKNEDTVDSRDIIEILRKVLESTKVYKTVTKKDLYGAVKGLLIISHTYHMDIEKLRKGIISMNQGSGFEVFKAESTLGMDDLHVLTETALELGFINTAAKCIRSAIKAGIEEKADKAMMRGVLGLKKRVLNMHNSLLTKRKTFLTDEQVTHPYILNEEMEKHEKQPKFIKNLKHQEYDLMKMMKYEGDFYDMERMMEGCRSGQSTAEKSDITCNLVQHSDPYVKLGPFKLEYASRSPHVVVLHDIMTEEDIQHFVQFASPRLSRDRGEETDSSYSRREREEGKVKVIYKSVQAWMKTIMFAGDDREDYTPDNFTIIDRRAEKLSARLEKCLNLNVTGQWSSHQYQVTNYGIGGLCETHIDPFGYLEGVDITSRNHLRNTGDYIGTVMGWLQDTPAGGSTTFFKLNTRVNIWPTRGSAAFWFSLYRDGVRDPASSHGGCPVAVGSKWILNKWIYSFNNWNKQPCHPSHTQKFQYQDKVRMTWPDTSYY